MENNRMSSIWVALLGVIIGALGMLLYVRIDENKKVLQTKYEDWGKLNSVLKIVRDNYVDEVDLQKSTDAALDALMKSLDPHSNYMPPVELKSSEEELAANFDGIGIQFNVPNDTAIVLEVIPGGPSEKIGLKPGDRLVKVDDKVIAGVSFPQDSMVRRIKGPAGSKVLITVQRGSETIPFEITRGKIPTHSIDASFMLNDSTGYVRISKFSATTSQEFLESSRDLIARKAKHMIVDIRENSGGYMDPALFMSNMFLSEGDTVVYLEGLHTKREVYKANGKGILKDMGLQVLINEYSASASEIFAGAIQDNGRGQIIGRRSFGKGLVQRPFYFNDGSGIRLTIARYYTPSGRCIQKDISEDYNYETIERYGTGELVCADSIKADAGGIIPDIFVPMDTTKATKFYIGCNKKATAMRFASSYFDAHSSELSKIDDYQMLLTYLEKADLEKKFLSFAESKDSLKPEEGEWELCKTYMMPQIKALVGRYSKLGDNAFYHIQLEIDDTVKAALKELEKQSSTEL